MDDTAIDKALGAQGRDHPPGFQYCASPKPNRAPQSRVREENGAVSKRIHSAWLHHFLAKAIDLLNQKHDRSWKEVPLYYHNIY